MTNDEKEREASRLIHEALGAASMCWTPNPSGEFDSARAADIGAKLLDDLQDLATGQGRLEFHETLEERRQRIAGEFLTAQSYGGDRRGPYAPGDFATAPLAPVDELVDNSARGTAPSSVSRET